MRQDNPAVPGPHGYPPARQAWYAICLFSLVNALDNVDRGIISILIEPIKRDLLLSDTQMSMLIGIAFSLFYAMVGLPMSRFADIGHRRNILAFGIVLWSLATAAGALATGFKSLFVCRGLTGTGESLKGPNALSMISDLVPRHKYPTAMAIYNLGISAGAGLSLIIGGALMGLIGGRILDVFGVKLSDWQFIFMLVGLPGVLIGMLVLFTVREPVRRGRENKGRLPVGEIFRFFGRERRIYLPIMIGSALMQIEVVGLLNWRVPFYQRTFGWGPEVVGPLVGSITLFLTPIGLALGAIVGERMAKRDPGAMIKLSIWGTAAGLALGMTQLLMPTPELAVSVTAVNVIVIGIAAPAAVAALQTVTPNEFRGQIMAVYLFTISVIGTALGPLSVALFTDYLFVDESMLRYAMLLSAGLFGGTGLLLKFVGLRPYTERVASIIAAEEAAAHGPG